MPAAKDSAAALQAAADCVVSQFREHTSAHRVDTKSAFLNFVRENYPGYHVAETEQGKVSLFEFAAAGKAEIYFDTDDDAFHATRLWKSVGEGIEKKVHPGKLDDDYRLVRFQLVWESNTYIGYYVVWKDIFENPQRMFYILYPRSESNIVHGHCIETDDLFVAAGKWTSQLHEEVWIFDDGHWEKSKELWKSVSGSSWEDVILDPEMKKNLIEDVQGFFDNQELYAQFAVPWKRGIILHGVPGNGKTVSIKALMSSLYSRADNIPSLYVKSFDTKCQTEAYSIRQIFVHARRSAPCLLIFEDLDSLVGDDVRSYFLNEVDGLESNDGILMIGSTNHLDKLDPAIAKRPSRFDRKYHFKLPGEAERELYAEYWRRKLLRNDTVEFPEELCGIVAKLTEGFSFAYLKELFVMALLSLVRGFKGDDFEIVDATDAESAGAGAEGENDGGACGADAQKASEKEVCTCATKCATCNKPLPAQKSKCENEAEEAEEKKEEVKKNKMVMPTVEVPDEYAENLLLKVIKHQIRILHAEMDNTKQDEWMSGKMGMAGGAEGGMGAFYRMLRRRRC